MYQNIDIIIVMLLLINVILTVYDLMQMSHAKELILRLWDEIVRAREEMCKNGN